MGALLKNEIAVGKGLKTAVKSAAEKIGYKKKYFRKLIIMT
jgi:hypothetical protein